MITKSHTIRDILMHNPMLELVLDRFDMHPSNNDVPLEKLSCSYRVEISFIVEILNLFDGEEPFPKEHLKQFSIPVVLDYLQRTHRYYINKRLFELEHTLQQVIAEHNEETLLCEQLERLFSNFKNDLWVHIELEENYLFPHIRFLMTCARAVCGTRWLHRKLKNFSVKQFIRSHESASEAYLHEIREVILSYYFYSVPHFSPLDIFIKQTLAFEKDLRIHELVEEVVLLPKALQLEESYFVL